MCNERLILQEQYLALLILFSSKVNHVLGPLCFLDSQICTNLSCMLHAPPSENKMSFFPQQLFQKRHVIHALLWTWWTTCRTTNWREHDMYCLDSLPTFSLLFFVHNFSAICGTLWNCFCVKRFKKKHACRL